jgi:hypothetical protein
MPDQVTPTPIPPAAHGSEATPTLDGGPEQATPADSGQTAPSVALAHGSGSASNQTPPNQYSLQGNGLTIQYGWFGSPAVMWYKDPNSSLTFDEGDTTLTDLPALGTVVSVKIVPGDNDTVETTFSLLLPPVEIPGQSGSVHIETFGITTVAPTASDSVPTYTVINLSGEATANNEPL